MSNDYFNAVYRKLGVLLTDDDLAGESMYQPLMPEVVERLDGAGLLAGQRRRQGRVPARVHQPRGRPAPVDRPGHGRGRSTTPRAISPACSTASSGSAPTCCSTSSAHRRRSTCRWCSRWPHGGLAACRRPRRCTSAFGNVLGDDRKMLRSRVGRLGEAGRAARRGGRAGRRGDRREEPRPRRRAAGRAGAHDRHRRGEVRRPVDRPHQGLRVRLGPDAVVRRQHGAVPAVRARPDLLDLPPGRRSTGRASARQPITLDAPQERALALRLLAYPTALATTLDSFSPHKLCTYVFDLASDFTAFYEHCPILKADEPLRVEPARARRPDRPRPRRTGSACSASTPRTDVTRRYPDSPRGCCPTPPTSATDGCAPVGGCSVADLAAEFGTPLFVYDEAHLRNRCREAVAAFGHRAGDLRDQGLPVPGDGATRVRRGAAARRRHPAASSTSRSRPACRPRPARCTATTRRSPSCGWRSRPACATSSSTPSTSSTASTRSRREGVGRRPKILLRITPGVHAHTHEFIATGQDDSKFGFNLGNGDALRAVDRARRSASVELVGLHCHIGSNVFEASTFAKAAEVMADFAVPLDLPELVLGGGLGVAYVESEEAPTITQWGNVLLDACAALGVRSNGQRRARPGDRRRRGDDRVHGRHDQGDPGRAHVRRGRRRDERQPATGAVRVGIRIVPAAGGRRRTSGDGAARRQALRDRRRAARSRRACRPTSRSATCWRRRSPARTATRWGRTTTRSRGRRSCSSPTARRASWCAARRSTTSSPPTSADRCRQSGASRWRSTATPRSDSS